MDFDLNFVPFSRYGSYLAFSVLPALPVPKRPQVLYLRTVHGGAAVHEIARVEVIRGTQPVPFILGPHPPVCAWKRKAAWLRFASLRLTRYAFAPGVWGCAWFLAPKVMIAHFQLTVIPGR